MPAHRTQNSRHLRVDANPVGAPPINIISPTPQTFVFSTDAMKTPASEVGSYTFASQASRSLPNLFTTFHASPNGEYANNFLDPNSPSGSHTSLMFTAYGDSPTSATSSFFASPTNSVYASSYGSSPPESPGTSVSPSPPPQTDGEYRRPRSVSNSSPAPYPLPLPPYSNGQVRTQPPRPPNPWICFRNARSAQYKEQNYPEVLKSADQGHSNPSSPIMGALGLDGENVRRPRQADLSKQISLEWKSLTDEEKAPFVRMSEEAKLVHARIYPGYKYQPRRKLEAGSGTKKVVSRSESAKKSPSKSKKGSKNKGSKQEELCEIEIDEKPSDQCEFSSGIAQLQLPALGIEISAGPGEEEDAVTGDPAKDWTWLPEQTLLPISWEPDHEFGTVDIMHPLDANVDESNETDEIEFGKSFYLSFPNADSPSEQRPLPAPFFPFSAEPESDNTLFTVPNFDFKEPSVGLQDNQFNGLPEISHLQDLANDFGLRRDSFDSTGGEYELTDTGDGCFTISAEAMDALGLNASYFRTPSPIPTLSELAKGRRASISNIPATPPPASPRRSSFAIASSSNKSPDGFLRPPTFIQPRSRSNTLPTRPGPSETKNDVRAISTGSFGNGISTSVLVPMTTSRFDVDMERDLQAYNLAMEYVTPSDGSSAKNALPVLSSQPATGKADVQPKSALLEDGVLDVNVEFDFEAEFADIIDMDASRSRST
ncbi:hypothetical protein BU17DRAFT_92192 [Hysterangium stoloniferum]|nr:hypothetical protein BU17DRAFT_92192 [Hysterangium stoloniferum]